MTIGQDLVIALDEHGLLGARTSAAMIGGRRTITVGKDGAQKYDYATIGEALAAAQAGDTIDVAAGTYDENLTISKDDITILGANAGTPGNDDDRGAETIINGLQYVFGTGVTLDGVSLTLPESSTGEQDAALYIGANDFTLTNSTLLGGSRETGRPFQVASGADDIEISDNVFANWPGGGFVNGPGDGRISGNEFRNFDGNAINFETPTFVVSNNLFSGSGSSAIAVGLIPTGTDLGNLILGNNRFEGGPERETGIFPSVTGSSIEGTVFDDVFYSNFGSGDSFRFIGDAGNDTMVSSAGNDTFTGGTGSDVLSGRVFGPTGGGARRNNFDGLNADLDGDTFVLGALSDRDRIIVQDATNLRARIEDDMLLIDANNDTVTDATIALVGSTSNTRISVDGNTIIFRTSSTGGGGGGTTPTPTPTPTPVVDNGTDGPDSQSGGGGNDTLAAGGGDDTVMGMAGDDQIQGNRGRDLLFGNQGNDTLFGGQDADTVFGGQDSDLVQGNIGDDVLQGNMGADTLYGGQGADSIYGGQGNDQLFGDLGNDLLSGDLGNDVLDGGAGADRLLFGANSGNDLVLNFSQADGDRLDLQGQTYRFGTAPDGSGSAYLVLSGGGTIQLAGITQGQVNDGFFTT